MPLTPGETLPTVGILYPGEMGAALGGVWRDDGLRVVTAVAERSERTRSLSRGAGLEELTSLDEVVRTADVIVSVVSPSAALAVAGAVAALGTAPAAPATDPLTALRPRNRVYVDANATSPATAAAIARVVGVAGFDYVDAAVNGLAAGLLSRSILYLSGRRAEEIARLMGRRLQVQVVGAAPGRAKALKGVLSGLSKGLTGLFVELDLQARASGVADLFEQRCLEFYPGVMEVVERMLPTYPRHARRRAEEMSELAQTSRALGLHTPMIRAAEEVTRALADAWLGQAPEGESWTWMRVLEALHRQGALQEK